MAPQDEYNSNKLTQFNDGVQSDVISLSMPINPAYVSAVRLTASSVANRLGFDVDEIEDVKAAVSEACTFIIKKMPAGFHEEYTISFHLGINHLVVKLKCKFGLALEAIEDEMGVLMIRTLMDELSIANDSRDCVLITMVKKHKPTFLD